MCRSTKRTINGFSMVELLVTLVLLGLIASVVAPQMDSWLSARQAAADRMAVTSRLALLPLQASRSGERVVIHNGEQLALQDLLIEFTQPIVVLANGYCLGGQFSLVQDTRTFSFNVTSPYCEVRRYVQP
jgi:general secretion pathway protein G